MFQLLQNSSVQNTFESSIFLLAVRQLLQSIGVLLGMTLFKYRWHIRWYWCQIKRRMLQNTSEEILLSSSKLYIMLVMSII